MNANKQNNIIKYNFIKWIILYVIGLSQYQICHYTIIVVSKIHDNDISIEILKKKIMLSIKWLLFIYLFICLFVLTNESHHFIQKEQLH